MKKELLMTLACLTVTATLVAAQTPTDSRLQAIQNAPNASAAVSAYVQAITLGTTDSLAANKAYVSKMAALGQPTLAFQQAATVVRQDGNDGLAWAVLAYDYADKNEPFDAFMDITKAVRLAPKDPFVIQTAGQLLAWYDSPLVDRDAMPNTLRFDLGDIRLHYTYSQDYLDAYRQATVAYAAVVQSKNPTTAPSTAQGPGAPYNPQPYSRQVSPPDTYTTPPPQGGPIINYYNGGGGGYAGYGYNPELLYNSPWLMTNSLWPYDPFYNYGLLYPRTVITSGSGRVGVDTDADGDVDTTALAARAARTSGATGTVASTALTAAGAGALRRTALSTAAPGTGLAGASTIAHTMGVSNMSVWPPGLARASTHVLSTAGVSSSGFSVGRMSLGTRGGGFATSIRGPGAVARSTFVGRSGGGVSYVPAYHAQSSAYGAVHSSYSRGSSFSGSRSFGGGGFTSGRSGGRR